MNQRKWIDFFINGDKAEATYDASLIAESMFDKLDLTHLSEEQIRLLMEGRLENVLKKYEEIVSEEALNIVSYYDRQHKFKHFAWAARQLAKLETEDEQWDTANELVAALEQFVKYGKQLKKRDINQYKTLDELTTSIHADVILPRIEKARKERMDRPGTREMLAARQASVIYEDERYFVVRPFTTEASCHFGSKTKWCIAQGGNSYFSSYTEGDGKVFYFMKDDSLKNEDDFYKIAIQVSMDSGEEPYFETFWDRHDENYDYETHDAGEFANHMSDEMGIRLETAHEIVNEIYDHVIENPPDNALQKLNERVYEGEWNEGFLSVDSDMDDYGEGVHLSVRCMVYIPWKIKSQRMIDMIDAGELDLDDIAERLQDDINENIYDSNTVAYDMFGDMDVETYHIDIDSYSDGVDVTEDSQDYGLNISLNLVDEDWGGYYSGRHQGTKAAADEAEAFMESAKRDWGEEKEETIIKAIDTHFYKLFPEMAEDIEEFAKLKKAFTDGNHEMIPEKTSYMIWDSSDEDDASGLAELVLSMNFEVPLHPKHLEIYFPTEEITNHKGDQVNVLKSMWNRPSLPQIKVAAAKDMKQAVADVVKSVWKQAQESAARQMPLDFGDGKDYSEQILPLELTADDFEIESPAYRLSKPWGSNTGSSSTGAGRTLVDYNNNSLMLKFKIRIDIDFSKSVAEMNKLVSVFRTVNSNYDDIENALEKRLQKYLWIGGITPENADDERQYTVGNPRKPRAVPVVDAEVNAETAIEEQMTSSYWLLKEIEKMLKD